MGRWDFGFLIFDFECMEFGRWVLLDLVPLAGEVERRSRDQRGARVEARLAAPTARQIGNWRGAYLSEHGTFLSRRRRSRRRKSRKYKHWGD